MFSVIIPTRDRPDFLKTAISSVLRQTVEDLEVIVVDDGDGSAFATIATLADRRLTAIDNQRRGPVPARNLGVAHATGTYIAFLDDDDWWQERDHLHRATTQLAQGCDFYFADGEMVMDDDQRRVPFSFSADRLSLERDNTILVSAVVYRRSLHRLLGPFDETLPFYWDWDWYLRVARSGAGLWHEPTPAVAIRTHAGNMSSDQQRVARRANLDRFASKHGLPRLELKNHLSIALGA